MSSIAARPLFLPSTFHMPAHRLSRQFLSIQVRIGIRCFSSTHDGPQTDNSALFLSPVWPERSSSAAGVRTGDLITSFQERGYNVAYATPSAPNEHTSILEDSGVRTFQCPPNRSAEIATVLQSTQPDVVIFDRFFAEEMFSFHVRDLLPKALRVLDMQDVHFLREGRRRLAAQGASMQEVMECQPDATFEPCLRELAAIHRSDLTLVCSPVEMDMLTHHYGVARRRLELAPFFVPPSPHAGGRASSGSRRHFMMIGNFKHGPNMDSVEWTCADVWPRMRAALMEQEAQAGLPPELHVYGSYAPQSAAKFEQKVSAIITY